MFEAYDLVPYGTNGNVRYAKVRTINSPSISWT